MVYSSVARFAAVAPRLPAGVVGILLCETPVHARASAERMVAQGVATLVAVGAVPDLDGLGCDCIAINEPVSASTAPGQINALIDALDGRWLLWHRNGEFFVYPFGETRSLADLVQFLTDERRKGIFTYALDLYAKDLPRAGVAIQEAGLCFDTFGYYAYPSDDKRLEIFGGLGWRFHELLPESTLAIGRTALFKAKAGVHLNTEMVFEDIEYASVSCPWHHSPTAAVMTLGRAQRISAHPNFPALRGRLIWQGSTRFDWTSKQLLDLGMIEPGQWF